MTGRPPLPIGAHGNIATRELGPKRFEARCRYRDADGATRLVKRTGKSGNAARTALQKALTERGRATGPQLGSASRVRDAGEHWLARLAERVEAGDRAPRTYATYESAWRLHVLPGLGELRLREATTAACEAWLVALRKRVGPSMASTSRAVLSGVLGYAARMGAIDANPVRDLSPIPGAGSRVRKPRSMTADERAAWLEWMDHNVALPPRAEGMPARRRTTRTSERTAEVAASRALGDVTRFMLATGVRVGEAMAVSWDEVDFVEGEVAIQWHIVRIKGQGLVRMPGAKSEAGDRVLRLPSWGIDMLRARRDGAPGVTPVFPDALGGWRDPNLVLRWIRWSRDEAGFGWVTSHVFRQTVITVLDDAGLSAREVSNQAGHARVSQTQDYMQRRVASEKAAAVLEDLL